MKSVLFCDLFSPFSYDLGTLKSKNLGGVEASVVRVAEKLGEKHSVVVAQGIKSTCKPSERVQYVPFSPSLLDSSWDAVISIRSMEAASQVRAKNPQVPLWIWFHDLIDIRLFPHIGWMVEKKIGAIVVSDFQERLLLNIISIDPYLVKALSIKRIYNPIDDLLTKDLTPYDNNKLLFASSPHKGLNETLHCFKKLKEEHPRFELFVTNPGYFQPKIAPQEGVTILGSLSHYENIHQMRTSLALFQLNHVHPETFGLTLAEANAVGTPVLTHPIGSVEEVLLNKEQ